VTRTELQRFILGAVDASTSADLTGAGESILEMMIDSDRPRVPAVEMARIIAAVVEVASDETLRLLAHAATTERAIVDEAIRDQARGFRVDHEGAN
jgi:hypothetical protein